MVLAAHFGSPQRVANNGRATRGRLQLKADDADTARLLVRECWGEGSLGTAEGKLQVARCMRRKYDEGVRGTRTGW